MRGKGIIKPGPFIKQMKRDRERTPGMKEVTIWIDDDSTGNKVQVENGEVTTIDHAVHLMRSAWSALDTVNETPEPSGESADTGDGNGVPS